MIAGLYDGPNGDHVSGGVFQTYQQQQDSPTNVLSYKQSVESYLLTESYWRKLHPMVKYWSQEVFEACSNSCVANSSLPILNYYLSAYLNQIPLLLNAGPQHALTAARDVILGKKGAHYAPIASAYWLSETYGYTMYDLDLMMRLVSLTVYSLREYASSSDSASPVPRRLIFAWNDWPKNATVEQTVQLGVRLLDAVSAAYGPGGTALAACYDSAGAYWCDPALPGASFGEVWDEFYSW